MITVVGIVFSITIVSLSLASQQFGPRLLQNFMRDRGNQIVLGTVTSTFLYCLLVLRTVSKQGGDDFVPHLSLLFGMGLAVLCVGVLIYFIHHVAESIQVTNVIASVSRDMAASIDRVFPIRFSENLGNQEGGASELAGKLPDDFDEQARPLRASFTGYLQLIDVDGLLDLAVKKDLIIRILHRVGHFIVPGSNLVEVWPGDAAADEAVVKAVNRHFSAGHKRTQEQDLEFLVNELVEIAGRALSPGINDPFTAISCIDHLGLNLCHLARRAAPSLLVRDREDRPRLIIYPATFDRIVEAAFNQIRQYGQSNAAVSIRLLETIQKIIPFTHDHKQRDALLAQAAMIERGSHEGLLEKVDRLDVRERYLAILETQEECFGPTDGC